MKVKLDENYLRAKHNTLRGVQGHYVKYLNRNNLVVDWPFAFKFGTQFHHVTGNTVPVFKVKSQRSQGQKSRSQRKVMYEQQKRYNTAMNRFSDLKLRMVT